jgi:hypothetical protein
MTYEHAPKEKYSTWKDGRNKPPKGHGFFGVFDHPAAVRPVHATQLEELYPTYFVPSLVVLVAALAMNYLLDVPWDLLDEGL